MHHIRDPFNVRRGPAVSLLRSTPGVAADTAASYTQTDIANGQLTFEDASAGVPSDMSFSRPRNAPAFGDPQQRKMEDSIWSGSGKSRFPETGHSNGVAGRIGSILGDKKELPMYKDKPYNYARSRRKPFWPGGKRLAVLLLLVFFAMLYLLGVVLRGTDAGPNAGTTSKLWEAFSKTEKAVNWDERRERVKDAFRVSWDAYEKHAWGFDEFHPVSKDGRQMVPDGMGWIIVDALDTLMLMNLTTQLSHAQEWISTTLTYDKDHDVNTFETTIRMLGGLLSAHYLSTAFPNMAPIGTGGSVSSEDLYLEKASDLADRLLGAYDSQSGVPFASVNLRTMRGIPSHVDGGASSTAEATSLQLEMKYLSKLTGEKVYWDRAEKVMEVVDDNGMQDGLLPIFIYADRGTFRDKNIRLGSRGDSYYEYLIKQYLQTSKQEPVYLSMWDQALAGIRKHLITYSYPSNLTVLGERPQGLDGELSPKMDHLVCFMPGTVALGATGGRTLAQAKKDSDWGRKQEEELELAKQLMKTCYGMYKLTRTGLAPEIAHFNLHSPPKMMKDTILKSPDVLSSADDADWRSDYIIKNADKHNLQRPETVESLFYMWRITGDIKYREWGWEIFQSFMEHTAVENDGGFTSINDVNTIPPPSRNNMESFWLAETLKYFYLLFGPDDVLPLDQVVFNTEAHPFPRFELGKLFSTGWQRKPRDADGNLLQATKPQPSTTTVIMKATDSTATDQAH